MGEESIRLELEDDGTGCGTAPSSASGIGMKTMHHRARRLGGEFSIGERPEGGTRVAGSCPQPTALAADDADAAAAGVSAAR